MPPRTAAGPNRSSSKKARGTRNQSPSGGPKRTPRWLLTIFFSLYSFGIVWFFVGNSARGAVAARGVVGLSPQSSDWGRGGKLDVPGYVLSAARAAGVNPHVATWIVSHESRYHPKALGDGGDSRGIWQINKVWHPEVSDKCAFDVRCSTDWSLRRLAQGNAKEWSTWKYCRERFDDCPF